MVQVSVSELSHAVSCETQEHLTGYDNKNNSKIGME